MDIEKEINDLIAPVTRAYSNFQIERVSILGSEIQDTRATFTVVFSADRKPVSAIDAVKEMLAGKPNMDDLKCPGCEHRAHPGVSCLESDCCGCGQ